MDNKTINLNTTVFIIQVVFDPSFLSSSNLDYWLWHMGLKLHKHLDKRFICLKISFLCCIIRKILGYEFVTPTVLFWDTYNHRQNCWDTLQRDVYIRPPSSVFVHLLLVDPNIAWWVRGKYGMLEDSVDLMLKKALFQHLTIYVNTAKLIQHFCLSVLTTFDEHCSTWTDILVLCYRNSQSIVFSTL